MIGAVVTVALGVASGCGGAGDPPGEPMPPTHGELGQATPPPPDQRQMFVAPDESVGLLCPTAEDATEMEGAGQTSLTLYGQAGQEDPFASADLGLWYSADAEVLGATEGQDDERDTTSVRGKEAFIDRSANDPRRDSKGAAVISWIERDDLAISLRSHSYSVDELVTIAAKLDLSGTRPRLGAGDADDLDEILVNDDVRWAGMAIDRPIGPGVRSINYWQHPVTGADLGADTWTFSDERGVADLVMLFRFDHPGATSVGAGQRDVLLYQRPTVDDFPDERSFLAIWLESPTVVVIAGGVGENLTKSDILSFVAELRPATAEEAAQLLAPSSAPLDSCA